MHNKAHLVSPGSDAPNDPASLVQCVAVDDEKKRAHSSRIIKHVSIIISLLSMSNAGRLGVDAGDGWSFRCRHQPLCPYVVARRPRRYEFALESKTPRTKTRSLPDKTIWSWTLLQSWRGQRVGSHRQHSHAEQRLHLPNHQPTSVHGVQLPRDRRQWDGFQCAQ